MKYVKINYDQRKENNIFNMLFKNNFMKNIFKEAIKLV
jgi:hypothetical protein